MQAQFGVGERPILPCSGGGWRGGLEIGAQRIAQVIVVSPDPLARALARSGGGGEGVLHWRGNSYRFTVGGLGVGGFGVSKMQASMAIVDATLMTASA